MFEYFTGTEIGQLNELKENLLVCPKEYFFKRFNDYTEFKETNYSSLSLQWHYLSSGFTLVIEAFKILAQAIHSLIKLNFSVAGDEACKATKTALAAIAKLTLDLGLLCLHITRLLTILIATFLPQLGLLSLVLAAIAFAYLSYPTLGIGGLVVGACVVGVGLEKLLSNILFSSDKIKHSKKLDILEQDLADYRHMLKEVGEERIQLIEAIRNITDARSTEPPLVDDDIHQFFSTNPSVYRRYLQKKAEAEELSSQYDELINSYPYRSVGQARNEPYSIKIFRNEILEHHEKVKIIATECLNRVNNRNYQRTNMANTALFSS